MIVLFCSGSALSLLIFLRNSRRSFSTRRTLLQFLQIHFNTSRIQLKKPTLKTGSASFR
uniref:Uncharacterized protein n=1 Tax=Arundo donax TaxID=35708 RepID=A0A0A8XTK1_ARUDO